METARPSFAMLVLLALLGGCDGPSSASPDKMTPQPPPPTANVQMMNLTVSQPSFTSEGFVAIVAFYRQDRVFPLTAQGPIEIRVFEVRGSEDSVLAGEPFKAWTFGPANMEPYIHTLPYGTGWGYYLPATWGSSPPKTDKIIIQARFRYLDGNYLYAKPLIMPMAK